MRGIFYAFLLAGCVNCGILSDLELRNYVVDDYTIAIWQKDTNYTEPVHIYIEGDGHAFDGHGRPTTNPTPRGHIVRDLATRDPSPNVAYVARPCQFVMSPACNVHDWTSGRFSQKIIDEMSSAVRHIARNRPIVLIGYSGGALISGLIIEQNPDLDIREWITIAGVLNHSDWTAYFGDMPLNTSLNMSVLPRIASRHYIAEHDSVVPKVLSEKWVGAENIIIVPGATHTKFPNFGIDKI